MTTNVMQQLTRIVQSAALLQSASEQVSVIVDAISDALDVDVCTLYRKQGDGSMSLIATHGLLTRHPVKIPEGQGLVGRIANLRHSINLVNPEQHPDYYFVPQSSEDQFHSFYGVPLFLRGDIVGVLVVQRRRAQALDSDQEAFLTTLAMHLALLVNSLPEEDVSINAGNVVKKGIRGAQGIAIGNVSCIGDSGLSAAPEDSCESYDVEWARWLVLRKRVVQELEQERCIVRDTLGESLAAVIDAYQMLLDDPNFSSRIDTEILSGKSLPWALKRTVKYFSDQFLAMDDLYLKARHEDIQQLGDKLYQSLVGGAEKVDLADSSTGIVLIGRQIGISDIVGLSAEQLSGIVCFEGAALSHVAVFANALGIPAVMGVGELNLSDGDEVIVDGDSAKVILWPEGELLKQYQQISRDQRLLDRSLAANVSLASDTLDGVSIDLFANAGLQADMRPGLRNGAQGVGLYRTEIPFMIRHSLPTEDEQTAVYRELVDVYQGKPVYIRTLDIGADKPLPYLPHVREENPVLGLRGVRFTLDNAQLMVTQFRAIMRAAEGSANVNVILPMIGSTQELDQSIYLLNEAYEELVEEGYKVCKPKLGVMLEIPAVISLMPFWRDKLDFVSVGTNDLSQYLLALDRNNPQVAKLYDSLHPSVLHELHRAVRIAKEMKLPLSVCGEMASDPVAVLLLLGMGVRRLSISSSKIPLIKHLVRSISISDAEVALQEALGLDNAADIRACGERAANLEALRNSLLPPKSIQAS
jgi:phosphotransferase system, enzyme I, PtsP